MLTLEDKLNISELLSGMELNELLSISSTVTNGLLKPNTANGAIEAIILHSPSVESVLNRRRISKELLFNYLHWKKVSVTATMDKQALIQKILSLWKNSRGNVTEVLSVEKPEQKFAFVSTSTGTVQVQTPQAEVETSGSVDVMALQFAKWFYSLLNKDFLEGGNIALGAEHFWQDASMSVKVQSSGQVIQEEANNSVHVVNLISSIKQRHNLYFSPNLCYNGVRGKLEAHGLVLVVACGTLHQSVGHVVGVFEQIFSLIKDPLASNSWKIKRSEVLLTSNQSVSVVPTLQEGQLMRTLFPLDVPD